MEAREMTQDEITLQMVAWMDELVGPDSYSCEGFDMPHGLFRMRCKLWTFTNCYSIDASWKDGAGCYLGCTAASRKPRAGENWTRGNDLPDGPFCQETFDQIVRAIVKYEAVEVAGTVSDVSIESRALTANEIQQSYETADK